LGALPSERQVMELFFNLLWLLVALVSFAQWRRVVEIRRGARGRIQAVFPCIALVCALAILFPTISVTDNLHPGLLMTEDGSRSRRSMAALAGVTHGGLAHPNHASPPALIPSPSLPFRLELIAARRSHAHLAGPLITLARILPSRAPPSL
jgi:hypothetical protein